MIKINANNIRTEQIETFTAKCQCCGSHDVSISIEGAEEHGEVGVVWFNCNSCELSERSSVEI